MKILRGAPKVLRHPKGGSENNVGIRGGLLKFGILQNQHMTSSYRLDGRHQSTGKHSVTINI